MAANSEALALSIEETCRISGLGRSSIYKLIKEGRLPVIKIGRRTLVKRSTIEALLNEVV